MIKILNNIAIQILIIIIYFYKFIISPLLKSNCRFLPTCSEYSIMALKEHGFLKGSVYSIKRIFACHPFGKNGYDPVPNKIDKEI